MRKLLIAFVLLFSTLSFADTFRYRLFESSIDQFTPFVLIVDMDGAFIPGSIVQKVTLVAKASNGETPLFIWSAEALVKSFKFIWNAAGNLEIFGLSENTFKSVVQQEISNPWGDTSINPNDEYSVYTDLRIELSQTSTLNDMEFVIANESLAESCLWGILKK